MRLRGTDPLHDDDVLLRDGMPGDWMLHILPDEVHGLHGDDVTTGTQHSARYSVAQQVACHRALVPLL